MARVISNGNSSNSAAQLGFEAKLEDGMVALPDKPNSRPQIYRLAAAKQRLEKLK